MNGNRIPSWSQSLMMFRALCRKGPASETRPLFENLDRRAYLRTFRGSEGLLWLAQGVKPRSRQCLEMRIIIDPPISGDRGRLCVTTPRWPSQPQLCSHPNSSLTTVECYPARGSQLRLGVCFRRKPIAEFLTITSDLMHVR